MKRVFVIYLLGVNMKVKIKKIKKRIVRIVPSFLTGRKRKGFKTPNFLREMELKMADDFNNAFRG